MESSSTFPPKHIALCGRTDDSVCERADFSVQLYSVGDLVAPTRSRQVRGQLLFQPKAEQPHRGGDDRGGSSSRGHRWHREPRRLRRARVGKEVELVTNNPPNPRHLWQKNLSAHSPVLDGRAKLRRAAKAPRSTREAGPEVGWRSR